VVAEYPTQKISRSETPTRSVTTAAWGMLMKAIDDRMAN
jgi:hypothetical protein